MNLEGCVRADDQGERELGELIANPINFKVEAMLFLTLYVDFEAQVSFTSQGVSDDLNFFVDIPAPQHKSHN